MFLADSSLMLIPVLWAVVDDDCASPQHINLTLVITMLSVHILRAEREEHTFRAEVHAGVTARV